MKHNLLNPFSTLLFGLLLGAVARLLDIYTQNLGNIFSQLAIWILLGALIAVYSPTRKRAMLNVLLFCLGMVFTYYLTAILTHGIYGRSFIIGWTVFALCSPVFAYFAWMTKLSGFLPKAIALGIISVSVLSTVVLFDRLRFYDYIINAALIYVLFFAKVRRTA